MQQILLEKLLCQKYYRSAAGGCVYSAAKQTDVVRTAGCSVGDLAEESEVCSLLPAAL